MSLMLDHHKKFEHLRESEFLKSASEDMIRLLADQVETLHIPAEYRIFKRGDVGLSMYIVVDGSVRVHDDDVVIKHLQQGDIFGEIGALASEARTASVTADTDSTLYELGQNTLYHAINTYPDTAKEIITALCKKESLIVNDGMIQAIKASQLERELEIAHNIQRSFLPDNLPKIEGWNLNAYLKPAREVAGDFYDFFPIQNNSYIGVFIGDVCDKGTSAALFMTLFRTLLRSTSLFEDLTDRKITAIDLPDSLKTIVKVTNNYIATTHSHSNMFASVFFGFLNPASGDLFYINAGHEAPIIKGAEGIRSKLETTGPVIGLFPGVIHEVNHCQIMPGEFLVGYTDGVSEARNIDNEMYTEERLIETVINAGQDVENICKAVVSDLDMFVGKADQYDDTTMIIIGRNGEE